MLIFYESIEYLTKVLKRLNEDENSYYFQKKNMEMNNYWGTTNTGSNSISGFKINDNGALRLIDANGITAITDAVPTDMALSRDSKYLFAVTTGSGSISAYKVNNNGGLTSIGDVSGIPMSAVGLIAK